MSDKIFWCKCGKKKHNMGDWIGPYIYEKLTEKKAEYADPREDNDNHIWLTCGSIIQTTLLKPNVSVWGSGISDRKKKKFGNPKNIAALRGPYSKKMLERQGIKCATVLGDPALLLPRIYSPNIEKKYEIGVIPHYIDYEALKTKLKGIDGILVIDMDRKVEEVCDDIISCKKTISSSLHGIIVSHAYGIKSAWMNTINRLRGDGVKYLDYYASVGITGVSVLQVNKIIDITKKGKLSQTIESYKQPEFPIETDELWKSCPFISN